jgi:hypothetical protein
VDEILEIALRVAGVCERLGVPYAVVGSLASSLHGIPRATQDVDIVASLTLAHAAAFADALRNDFYLDDDAIREAIERRRSFNVVHLRSYFKADVFIPNDDESARLEMERRQRFVIEESPRREIVVASAEDTIAQKLRWYALGDRVSERQWRDALSVIKVAGQTLDLAYLRRVSAMLGVEELLDEALRSVVR